MRIRFTRQDVSRLGLSILEARWRDLEARADGSVFQSWTWVGCLLTERCRRPYLLDATDPGGTTVALGLFNRRRGRFWLHEAGDPAWDAPFIERNGLLVARGAEAGLTALFAALPAGLGLSGVADETVLAAGPGRALLSATVRDAPVLDLARPVLDSVTANTRAQLRRAMRRYGERGELTVTRAGDADAARAMLADLIALHDLRWQARDKPGAFADPRTRAFHDALLDRGVGRGEVDLLHVQAGNRTIGLLYNLRLRDQVFAYQGGFDYAGSGTDPAPAQMKPGLVCHTLAAEWYRARGATSYDLGAGDARYKRSLATRSDRMHWLLLTHRWSPRARLHALARRLRPSHPA